MVHACNGCESVIDAGRKSAQCNLNQHIYRILNIVIGGPARLCNCQHIEKSLAKLFFLKIDAGTIKITGSNFLPLQKKVSRLLQNTKFQIVFNSHRKQGIFIHIGQITGLVHVNIVV
ncbi:hypothetical protein SU32_05520 [Ahrensia marina]|uniref:Uncharacterized protein n=1 Tax=Ahrensia marina TaxID=1514904 RepID=A0A0N0E823_9HYPH|nr:hypothetical protein SU32_05520 [Ahrensia marina]